MVNVDPAAPTGLSGHVRGRGLRAVALVLLGKPDRTGLAAVDLLVTVTFCATAGLVSAEQGHRLTGADPAAAAPATAPSLGQRVERWPAAADSRAGGAAVRAARGLGATALPGAMAPAAAGSHRCRRGVQEMTLGQWAKVARAAAESGKSRSLTWRQFASP
jgi:hypothetical protein